MVLPVRLVKSTFCTGKGKSGSVISVLSSWLVDVFCGMVVGDTELDLTFPDSVAFATDIGAVVAAILILVVLLCVDLNLVVALGVGAMTVTFSVLLDIF